MIDITVQHDLDRLVGWAKIIAEDQVPYAMAQTLNVTGEQVRAAEQQAMVEQLDRPTRFTLNALFLRRATKQRQEVTVWLKDSGDTAARQYLGKQIDGGTRAPKRFEKALQRVGILPSGYVAVPSKAVTLDAHGNVPSRLIIQLLAYFQAFSEQGYSANMKDKGKQRLAKVGRSESGYLRINGVQYFVSYGRAMRFGKGSWKEGRMQHLAPGIWSKTGTHGSDVKPVFLFVPQATYRQRFTFHEVADRTIDAQILRNWREQWQLALLSRRVA